MDKIKVGIVGYGNLGKGVHFALKQNSDFELVAVFTRRSPESVKTVFETKVDLIENIAKYKGKIDVMILCGGSATDLPVQTPEICKDFCTVDSFDTHAKIPEYLNAVNKIAEENGNLSVISVGWDPGLFSIMRGLFESVAPAGETYTFWGKGVSQGHSDAIRRIDGVKNGIQYTVPIEKALNEVRSGSCPSLTTAEKHLRECFVVANEGADKSEIERQIKTMPNYFSDYETVVHFISEAELLEKHNKMPHGGIVLRSASSENENNSILEFNLKLDSNPEFTSSVLVSYARAIYRMNQEGKKGAVTVFDVPISYLSQKDRSQFIKELL